MSLTKIFCFVSILSIAFGQLCIPRDYGFGSIVCVCNTSHCDQLGKIKLPPARVARLYESNKNGTRFEQTDINFTSIFSTETYPLNIVINRTQKFQEILGFGGAFTDAAGMNILNLPQSLQNQILRGYYSPVGLDYTIGRVPMASCDFSTRIYSYDDVPGDFDLKHFSLAQEDLQLKIPLIYLSQNMSSKPIYLFASPWSAPGWMKNTGNMSGPGVLKGKPGDKYYQTWAEYFVKFLQAYKAHNINFWGVTAENEPTEGFIANYSFQAMGFTAEMQRDFIRLNLGPTLKKHGFPANKLNLMILDDQRFLLPKWADVLLNDTKTAQYVSGIAYHWYSNAIAPPTLLDITHQRYPNKFLLSTEACAGSAVWDKQKVKLGSWDRGEHYAHDIIQDLLHWTVGWVDWNLALNTNGGPNWAKNFVDAPIIVNITSKEFYRQPTYYALAHFSKFLPRGSVRIGLTTKGVSSKQIDLAAFQRPDKAVVLIIINRSDNKVKFALNDTANQFVHYVSPHSFQSYIWSTKS